MGVDVMGSFQRFDGERWVTLESNDPNSECYYDGQRGLLRFWLGWDDGWYASEGITPILSSPRGLPEDLTHENKPLTGGMSVSWLRGEEILAALPLHQTKFTRAIPTERAELLWSTGGTVEDWEAALGIFQRSPLSEDPRLAAVPVRHEGATEAPPGKTLVDCLWDYSKHVAYFTDEVLRLSKLHGAIRFVYGFE